ncbi:MAG TPA: chloride channel protein [Polyangiaceae bacterium]|nr:chloride channel protein [Polyangiaceae bacterium]
MRSVLTRAVLAARSPIPMQLLGRALLRAAFVGVAAGLVGSVFFAGVELVQQVVLERLCGYVPLRAAGERITSEVAVTPFRPWLVWLMPALGALGAGFLSRYAPETRGGGADAVIEAFHTRRGYVRRRVPLLKGLASALTLGFGGSGGREGPTMQMGGAIGSIIGGYLRVTDRERRILLVAGTAAGMAAVFRTPLGAALFAVEVLHRDDFETEALIPSVLASVVAYSVFVSIFGESTLFAHAVKYPFFPVHLPLYALLAVLVSLVASLFLGVLRGVQHITARIPGPDWVKPALGGLVLGTASVPVIVLVGPQLGHEGMGLGILGGGYGAAQVAITGAPWFPEGWLGIEMLLLLGLAKIIATSLTVGSGGSAGDFGPSLVIGGIFGGAFGRAAQLLLHDPRIDPGAFALVGMGTLYGGLAHVPIASLVMVCELAGSYDLLVPLMLATGISFIALRNRSLYHAQRPSWRESPAHRDELLNDVLRDVRVGDVVVKNRPYVAFQRDTPAAEVVRRVAGGGWQDVFPVLSADKNVVGVITTEVLRTVTQEPEISAIAIAHDLMMPPVVVGERDDVNVAVELLLLNSAREIVVVDDEGHIVGFLDEAEITQLYRTAAQAGSMP